MSSTSFILIIVLIAHRVYSDAQSCQCGLEGGKTRIVGGTKAQQGAYPWMVALLRSSDTSFFCGGTLINDRYILTAAHCVPDLKPADVIVIARQASLGAGIDSTNVLNVDNIWTNPEYIGAGNSYKNDMALLRLSQPVEINSSLMPICLPNANQRDFDNLFNMGFGDTSFNGEASPDLLVIQEKEKKDCIEYFGPGQVWEKQICTYNPGHGVCSGDSGGPLSSKINGRVTQVGINSFIIDGACGKTPDVMTRVSDYVDVIYQQTQDANYCENPNKEE